MKSVRLRDVEGLKGDKFALWQLLNPASVGSENLMLFVVNIDPGGLIPPHHHGPAEAAIYVLEGSGEFEVDGERKILSVGTGLCVPAGATIGLENKGSNPLRLVVVMSPPIGVEICPVCGILVKESRP